LVSNIFSQARIDQTVESSRMLVERLLDDHLAGVNAAAAKYETLAALINVGELILNASVGPLPLYSSLEGSPSMF
jgi:hypothetical protein